MADNTKAMAFGVFDNLHAGHRFFLRAASRIGNKLIVVVARNSAVQNLKRRMPGFGERKRLRAVLQLPYVWRAVLGDRAQGSYGVIQRYKPHSICLGYDQKALTRDLRAKMHAGNIPRVKLIMLAAFHPGRYHTSLLRARQKAKPAAKARRFRNAK